MFHTILFDLDGTLTDSREGIVNSVKYTIEKLGGTMPDAQTLLKFIGPPLQESFMEHCGYSREKAVAVMRTVPSDTPVTSPFSLTVATDSSEELHSRAISCMEAG